MDGFNCQLVLSGLHAPNSCLMRQHRISFSALFRVMETSQLSFSPSVLYSGLVFPWGTPVSPASTGCLWPTRAAGIRQGGDPGTPGAWRTPLQTHRLRFTVLKSVPLGRGPGKICVAH